MSENPLNYILWLLLCKIYGTLVNEMKKVFHKYYGNETLRNET